MVGCRGYPGPGSTAGAGPPPLTGSATELGFGTTIVGPDGAALLPAFCALAALRLPKTIANPAIANPAIADPASHRFTRIMFCLPCHLRPGARNCPLRAGYFDPSQQGVIITALL